MLSIDNYYHIKFELYIIEIIDNLNNRERGLSRTRGWLFSKTEGEPHVLKLTFTESTPYKRVIFVNSYARAAYEACFGAPIRYRSFIAFVKSATNFSLFSAKVYFDGSKGVIT